MNRLEVGIVIPENMTELPEAVLEETKPLTERGYVEQMVEDPGLAKNPVIRRLFSEEATKRYSKALGSLPGFDNQAVKTLVYGSKNGDEQKGYVNYLKTCTDEQLVTSGKNLLHMELALNPGLPQA